MVKTNAEKQKEYIERVKAKNSDLPKKKAGKEKEQRAFEEIPCTA